MFRDLRAKYVYGHHISYFAVVIPDWLQAHRRYENTHWLYVQTLFILVHISP